MHCVVSGDPMAHLVWRWSCQRWQTAGGGSNPCWSTRESQVRSAERQRAPTTKKNMHCVVSLLFQLCRLGNGSGKWKTNSHPFTLKLLSNFIGVNSPQTFQKHLKLLTTSKNILLLHDVVVKRHAASRKNANAVWQRNRFLFVVEKRLKLIITSRPKFTCKCLQVMSGSLVWPHWGIHQDYDPVPNGTPPLPLRPRACLFALPFLLTWPLFLICVAFSSLVLIRLSFSGLLGMSSGWLHTWVAASIREGR